MNIKKYKDFTLLFENKSIDFIGDDKDWVFIHSDKSEDDYNMSNRLGMITTMEKRNMFHNGMMIIKFVEDLKNQLGSENSKSFYYPESLNYEIVDKSIIEQFKLGKLLPLIKSDKLHFILNSFKFKYSSFFNDCSYFDLSEQNDTITMLPINKSNTTDVWTSKSRQPIKIGRFFKKLNPTLTDAKIENYVNLYKAKHEILVKNVNKNIRIVKGEDIRYWYSKNQYAKGGGRLNNSCMKYKKSQKKLDLYCDYPDKIGLLILTDEEGKLLSRALIWTLDSPKNERYMDVIYSVNDYYVKVFLDYAKDNNILFDITGDSNLIMKVRIKKLKHTPDESDYPFMDTFSYYFYQEGVLSNKINHSDTDNWVILDDY